MELIRIVLIPSTIVLFDYVSKAQNANVAGVFPTIDHLGH